METYDLNMTGFWGELQTLFNNGRRETFESGMYSVFSSEFIKLLVSRDYHQWVLDLVMHYILVYEWISCDVSCEACRWLGHGDHGAYCGNPDFPEHIESKDRRRLALEYILLNAKHAGLRDDASIGISSIDSPESIPAIKEAMAKERSDLLRGWYQQIVDQLNETQLKIEADKAKNSSNDT